MMSKGSNQRQVLVMKFVSDVIAESIYLEMLEEVSQLQL